MAKKKIIIIFIKDRLKKCLKNYLRINSLNYFCKFNLPVIITYKKTSNWSGVNEEVIKNNYEIINQSLLLWHNQLMVLQLEIQTKIKTRCNIS